MNSYLRGALKHFLAKKMLFLALDLFRSLFNEARL